MRVRSLMMITTDMDDDFIVAEVYTKVVCWYSGIEVDGDAKMQPRWMVCF